MDKELEHRFTEAFTENKDKIFRICRSYSDSTEDAEDLFQEVLINIWKSFQALKELERQHMDLQGDR